MTTTDDNRRAFPFDNKKKPEHSPSPKLLEHRAATRANGADKVQSLWTGERYQLTWMCGLCRVQRPIRTLAAGRLLSDRHLCATKTSGSHRSEPEPGRLTDRQAVYVGVGAIGLVALVMLVVVYFYLASQQLPPAWLPELP